MPPHSPPPWPVMRRARHRGPDARVGRVVSRLMTQIPQTGTARVHILADGYAREEDRGDRVGSTVTLITDGGVAVIVDPGMVSSRAGLLAALAARGVAPEAVTDVVFSHHHPDHTVNAALFRRRGSTTSGPSTR